MEEVRQALEEAEVQFVHAERARRLARDHVNALEVGHRSFKKILESNTMELDKLEAEFARAIDISTEDFRLDTYVNAKGEIWEERAHSERRIWSLLETLLPMLSLQASVDRAPNELQNFCHHLVGLRDMTPLPFCTPFF